MKQHGYLYRGITGWSVCWWTAEGPYPYGTHRWCHGLRTWAEALALLWKGW